MKRPITNLVLGCLVFLALQLKAQTTTFTISPTTITSAASTEFTVDVTVDDFNEILSFQYSHNFDPNILEFDTVINFNPTVTGLGLANTNTNGAANGEVTLSWFDNLLQGVTLPGGAVLYSMTFKVINETGTEITFSEDPTPYEIININSQEVTLDPVNCTVNGGGGGPPPPPPPVNGFALIGSDETVLPGEEFCVAVTVNDFEDIVSMQYTMVWDENLFDYIGVDSFNLPDLGVGNFGQTMTDDGILTLSWVDNLASGVTRDDGEAIYVVCFEAIGPLNCSNTTQFEFTDSPAIIEIINANSQEVDFTGVPGNLVICDGDPPPSMDFTFSVDDLEVAEDGYICVPIEINNAGCIASIQYSMHFNENVLQYDTIIEFGLPDMSIGGNFNVLNVDDGDITFSWFEQTGTGTSPANGTTIFEICFNAIGDEGDISSVTFDGSPTSIEVIDCNSQEADPLFDNGQVTIMSVAPCLGPVNITNEIVNDVPCAGGANGSVDISVSGGDNLNYEFNWENSSGTQIATTEDIFGRAAGQYCVTVTSCQGNETATGCYTISEPSGGALNVIAVTTNPACFGDASGSINTTVSGGTTSGPGCFGYTYAWSDSGSPATADRFGIGAGAYTVTVTDCNGCQVIENFNLASSPSELILTAMGTPVSCVGDCDGVVTASANGGDGPYEYRLTCGGVATDWQTSNVFEGQCAGSCFASVRDEFGCVETVPVSIANPNPISGFMNVTNDSDNCNGAINLTANGGTGGLSFSWTGPMGFTSMNEDLANLCPGEYCVTIEDANECQEEVCNMVIAPLNADATPASVEPACFGECDGEIFLNFTGGVPPFTYDWSSGTPMGQQPFTNFCSGDYTVTVTSSDGQSITISANVGEAAQAVAVALLDIDNVSTPLTNDGSVSVAGSGGFGGYTFDWAPGIGAAGSTVNGLGIDEYFVTVTDVEGCSATGGPYEVEYDPTVLSMSISSDPICNGATEGKLTINILGGLAPYDLTFDGPTSVDPIDDAPASLMVNDLLPGTYSVTVTDAAGGIYQQMDIETETIEEVEILLSEITVFPVTNAPANNNGVIDIVVEGGQLPYTYQWSNGDDAQNPADLPPGEYDLTVIDANGCIGHFENILVEIFDGEFNAAVPDCPDDLGSVTATPTGSLNTPFIYEWVDENGNQVGDEATLSNVPVGTYFLTITDSEDRSVTLEYELASESNLSATLNVTTDVNGFAIRCAGETSGAASVMVADGMPPYTYQWSNGSNLPTAENLSAGILDVVVMDATGCSFELSTELQSPAPLIVGTEGKRVNCGEDTGLAKAIPSGGVFDYEYNWDDPLLQTSQTAILLEGGEYNVTVVDANGCDAVATVDVPFHVPLEVIAASEPDEGGPNGKAIAVVVNGTPPYDFQWNDSVVTDSILTELLPGKYIVVVTDASDCSEDLVVQVDDATVCLDALTVITPEGDGFNEEFEIGCLSRYSDNELQIFNRWGQLVYKTTNYSNSDLWRGTTQRGDEVPDGVYFYVFDYLDPVNNVRDSKKGSVTVLRK